MRNWRIVIVLQCSMPNAFILIKFLMQNEGSNDHLAYWLSNAYTLLFLLQKSLKATGSSGGLSHGKPPPPTSLFGRMAQVCNAISVKLFFYFFLWDLDCFWSTVHVFIILLPLWVQMNFDLVAY